MKKILLIENHHKPADSSLGFLKLDKYEIISAKDGKEGLNVARKIKPDLIIYNILQEINGDQMFNNLINDKHTCDIPIIFLSEKPKNGNLLKLKNAVGDNYLTKPFLESDLIYAIESRLAKHALLKTTKQTHTPVPVLSSLQELREYMEATGESFEAERNGVIYHEQRHANYIYLIKSGLIKTHRMDEFGKELITGLYKKSDFFGFYYFKNPSSYPETATSLDASYLYRISSLKFQEVLASSQHLTLELAQLVSDNLSLLKNHLLEMAYASVLKKTTNTILQFAKLMPDNKDAGIKISRTDLASVAGISTESFIRSLSSLKKEGLIDIDGRNIKILNMQKLHEIK